VKFLFIFLLFVVSVFGSWEPKRLQYVSLQLNWKYQFEYAGFIAAKEKGFYKDVGLDVNIKEYKVGTDIEKDVISGRSTYGLYNSLSLLEYLRGKPLALVASFFKRSALVLVTSQDIKTPKDLVGKTIMAGTKEDFRLNFEPYFRHYGVDINSVKLVPHSYRIDEFVDKKVDGMVALLSNEIPKLQERGVKFNILDPSSENLFVLQLELITSQFEVINHPKRVKAFREASIKGWQYALKHKDEIIKIIHDKYNGSISVKDMENEADIVERLILPYTYSVGSIDMNFLKKQIALFRDSYHVKKDRKLNGYVYSSLIKSREFHLRNKELKYIKKNPIVNLCINYGVYPLAAYQDGKFTGVMSEIFDLISKKTSLKFNYIASKSDKDLMKKVKSDKCDLISLYSPQNQTTLTHVTTTHPFLSTNFTLVSTIDKSFISEFSELSGKTIVVQKEFFKKYLLKLYPNLNIVVEHNDDKMVQMVMQNKAYAIATLDERSDYFVDNYGYGKLKIDGFLAKEVPLQLAIAVRKDKQTLKNILNKSLSSIPQEKFQTILNSWRLTRYQEKIDYKLVFLVLFVAVLLFSIMFYYQSKLKRFNKELSSLVDEKTKELQEINRSLEQKVKEKVKEIIQKDKMLTSQAKLAVMGEMISMIAHQWRQPLNMVTLQISDLNIKYMLKQEIKPEKMVKTLENITQTITYLSDTIDDFQTYFRPNNKKSSIKILELLNRCQGFIQPRLKTESIKVDIKVKEDREILIYTNELVQVLLNILNNAIDAYAISQKRDKKIDISVDIADENIVFSVTDYAGGIKSKYISKLFEPYFSTKGKNGTGLGLYISKMIIQKQFDGDIMVKTSKDSTTFVVTILQGEER